MSTLLTIAHPVYDGAVSLSAAPTRAVGWPLALVATTTMAISYVDRQTLSVLAPTVTRALGLSDAQYGWLASAFSIAYLVGAPLSGLLVDRYGARRGLPVAMLTWSGVAALHALAPGFASLFALRIALGFAESPSFPATVQTMDRALPSHDRARGFALLFTGSSIGAMIAPPLATWLALRYGWRVAFAGTAGMGLLWLPLWLALSSGRRARAVLDRVEITREPPPQFVNVLFNPAVLRGVIMVMASAPAGAFVYLWAAKYLVATFPTLGQAGVGRLLWLPALLLDAGALAMGDLYARRAPSLRGRPDRLLMIIGACLVACVALVSLGPTPWRAVIAMSLALGGVGAVYALVTADMLSRVPARAVSMSGGMTAAAQSLAYVIASPLVGVCLVRGVSYRTILVGHALWVIPGLAVWLAWSPPPPRDEHVKHT